MERRQLAWAIPALVVFVFLSSFLGLGGTFLWFDPLGVFAFMGGVWADSALADIVFAVGSASAALASWMLAREHPWVAIPAGALTHLLVYTVSFLLLGEVRGEAPTGEDVSVLGAASFVAQWGWMGLAFASLAPPLARRWWLRREARAAAPDAKADAA